MMTLKELAAVTKAVSDVVRQHVAEAFSPLDGRIKALEECELPQAIKGDPGERGEDGKSVTLEDVAPIISEEVAKAVAEIERPKDGQDGKDADNEAIAAQLSGEVRQAAEEWLKANPPRDGKDGADAVAPTVEEIVERLLPAATQAALEWAKQNPPKDGVDGKDGESVTEEAIEKMVEERIAARLDAMQAKWELDFERRAQGVLERSVERLPKPKDGIDGKDGLGFDDLQMDYDGERTFTFSYAQGDKDKAFSFVVPMLLDRGVFKEAASYERGDVVTWGGSLWISQKDAPEGKPGLSDDWRLSVKRGRDAK